ncbi:MAG: YdcF family protein [Cytophagaceae bacterium]
MRFLNIFLQASLILIFVGFLLVSCLNRNAEKSYYYNKVNTPYDAIIVPGFPFKDDEWHVLMKFRVYWSYYLYSNGYTKNVIYSGAAVYSPYVESKIMKEYAIALGIPSDHIFIDTLANHSTENLYYSCKIAKNQGFEKVALATDPFQNAALSRFAKNNNIQVDFVPVVFDILKEKEMPTPEIDQSKAFVKDFVSLPEQEDFFERLRGTLGRDIDTTLYSK